MRGTVQGVGFRPFVHRLALRRRLAGWVRNSAGPVEIEVEGERDQIEAFLHDLVAAAPPLARIEEVTTRPVAPVGEPGFRILASAGNGRPEPVPPDAATCADCLRELFDPRDRRHRYPFVNCVNCGPRYTIILSLPYDRASTTMRDFAMCAACRAEYEDPDNRRYHAEPIACPACGPSLDLPLAEAVAALRAGLIVAVKGLGGWQLACDATAEPAVGRLRERKRRPTKPLAVMLADPAPFCELSEPERELLGDPAHPIVLLRYRGGLAPSVAPGLRELGAMLPCTPLHHLLLRDFGAPVVMTSGNLSEEPIATGDQEARERLGGVADVFLGHDRRIASRCDDSVMRWAAGEARVLRRARGLAPAPLPLPIPPGPPVVATGGHLKAAFTITSGGRAFVSPHIGDLDDPLAIQCFAEALGSHRRLLDLPPARVACDLHPDYASTRIAEELGSDPIRVQHHHAHAVSVMAEHRLEGPVLAVVLDGTGMGAGGESWGGEVMVCDARSFWRVAHLEPVPLPGGDLCARQGWRMAAAYGLAEPPPGVDPGLYASVRRLAASSGVSTTTSAGRLFDAVACLLGVCQVSTYEGEAAALLEAVAGPEVEELIEIEIEENRRLFNALARRAAEGEAAGKLAAVFHNSLAGAVVRIATRHQGLPLVLSGGCFQNRRLLEACLSGLNRIGRRAHANCQVPAHDGGLSLGQAVVAAWA